MTEKERIQRSKFAKGNGNKVYTEENRMLYVCVCVCVYDMYVYVYV